MKHELQLILNHNKPFPSSHTSGAKLSRDYRYLISVRWEFSIRHTPTGSCYILHIPDSSLANFLANSLFNSEGERWVTWFYQCPCVQPKSTSYTLQNKWISPWSLLCSSNSTSTGVLFYYSMAIFQQLKNIHWCSTYEKYSPPWMFLLLLRQLMKSWST